MQGIYKITNSITGDFYIGSSVDIVMRWAQHRWSLRRKRRANPILQHAWDKYGEAVFVFDILQIVISESDLLDFEQDWIDELKPVYNIRRPADTRASVPSVAKDLVGVKFGRWTPISRAANDGYKIRFLCRCECGRERVLLAGSLASGNSQSCGCLKLEQLTERNSRHQAIKIPEYAIWRTMRASCLNPNSRSYAKYGGRAIAIAPEWNDFATFLQDVGLRPADNYCLTRLDNDGNYCPGNVAWLPNYEAKKKHAGLYTFQGQTKTIKEWSDCTGIKHGTLIRRLQRKMPLEQALTMPVQSKFRGK